MKNNKNSILLEEEIFHDNWAKGIDPDELCVLEAFEGSVSPEYSFAINLMGNLTGKKILNPGCGAGEEAVYLAKNGGQVLALDISREMLKVAQKLAVRFCLYDKIDFAKMNTEKLNLPDESYDLIFGNSILHHTNIEDSVRQFHRVLKKGGKAIFIEPLSYNPAINFYRSIANIVRTPKEHPLKFSDIHTFEKYFSKVRHYEFQFLTLVIFFYFFFIQRVHPNKDRYWKKIIREGKRYKNIFQALYTIDKIILSVFPFLKRFCWVTVIEGRK